MGPKGPSDKTNRRVAPKAAATNNSVAQPKNPEQQKNQMTRGPKGRANKGNCRAAPRGHNDTSDSGAWPQRPSQLTKLMRGPERLLQ